MVLNRLHRPADALRELDAAAAYFQSQHVDRFMEKVHEECSTTFIGAGIRARWRGGNVASSAAPRRYAQSLLLLSQSAGPRRSDSWRRSVVVDGFPVLPLPYKYVLLPVSFVVMVYVPFL